MREVVHEFQQFNKMRNEQSRPKENFFHVAEFFSSGQGEFDPCSSPE